VSAGDGVGSDDGVGVETVGVEAVAVLGLLPHATTRRPAAIAATKDLSILKV
jgi:hypothetical protein